MNTYKYIVQNNVVGYLNYTISNNDVTIEKVFIDDIYRGNNYAKMLMEEFILFCKNNKYNINATCSYAVNYLNKRTN